MAALVAFAAQAQDRADRQELTDPDSFTMILLGDPQGYTKYDINRCSTSARRGSPTTSTTSTSRPCSARAIWSNRTKTSF